jgi:hypothetical protein
LVIVSLPQTSNNRPMITSKMRVLVMEFPAAVAHFYFFLKRNPTIGLPSTLFCLLFEPHFLNQAPLIFNPSNSILITAVLIKVVFHLFHGFVTGYAIH